MTNEPSLSELESALNAYISAMRNDATRLPHLNGMSGIDATRQRLAKLRIEMEDSWTPWTICASKRENELRKKIDRWLKGN